MSPSSLPPRLRDTKQLEDLVRQEKVNLRQLGVGFAGGRFSPLRPRTVYPDIGEDDEDYESEAEIKFWNTDRMVAVGPGMQPPFQLTHTPIDGSLHIRWNGLDQAPTEWTLADNVVTIPDTEGFVRAADVFTAAYAYIEDNADQTPVNFTFITQSAYDSGAGSSPLTSLAMPAGAQSGDLVLLTAIGGFSAGGGYARVPDTRFGLAWSGPFCTRDCIITSAVLGSDLSAIQLDVRGMSGSPVGQFVGVLATLWRPVEIPGSMSLDGRVAATPDDGSAIIQGLGGGGSGAFAVIFECAGIGGVTSPTGIPSPWTDIAGCGIYAGMRVLSTTNGAPPQTSYIRTDIDDGYMAVTVGIGYD